MVLIPEEIFDAKSEFIISYYIKNYRETQFSYEANREDGKKRKARRTFLDHVK